MEVKQNKFLTYFSLAYLKLENSSGAQAFTKVNRQDPTQIILNYFIGVISTTNPLKISEYDLDLGQNFNLLVL